MTRTNDHVHRADLAARFERPGSSEYVQTGRATRYSDGGTGIHIGYAAENAPESNQADFYLDYDGSKPQAWANQYWNQKDTVIGDDTLIYRCTTGYNATDDTTKPGVTGQEAVWGAYWTVIEVVTVHCRICGGGNLIQSFPHLSTTMKSSGYDAAKPAAWSPGPYGVGAKVLGSNPMQYWKCSTAHTATLADRPSTGANYATYWTLVTWEEIAYVEGDIVPGTNEYELYSCLDDHTGTADTRPSDGSDCESKWEVTFRSADVLPIIEVDGIWVPSGQVFQACVEDAPNAP